MARIPHWIQNKSVDYYPTNHMRQLYTQPGSEFSILHLQLLNNGDRFANFIQWFSMLGSIVIISLIAKLLGATFSGQIFSSVIATTIPMGILQGSSTQNDYAAAFWLVSFICYVFLRSKNAESRYILFAAATSLGLGFLTKGTTYVYSAPFIVLLLISEFRKYKFKAFKSLSLILIVPILINLGYFLRNYDLGKDFFSPFYQGKQLSNEAMSPALFISNSTKNLALHLGARSDKTNDITKDLILKLHNLINIDINDTRTAFLGMEFVLPKPNRSEDQAGNPLHLFLSLGCMVFLFLSKDLRTNRTLRSYLLCSILSFTFFILLVKWQPWHSRFHLSIFVIFCAFSGIAISKSNKFIAIIICFLLLANSIPYVFRNNSRRIVSSKSTIFDTPRMDQYFSNYPSRAYPYKEAVKKIKSIGCKTIGQISHGECWEYPLWTLLKENNDLDFQLEQVQVDNKSNKYLEKFGLINYDPCILVGLKGKGQPKQVINNSTYIKTWEMDPVSIYEKDTDGTLAKSNLLLHFNNAVKLIFNSTTQISQDKENKFFDQKNMKVLNYLRNELAEAQIIDTDELDNILPELGKNFKNIVINGLELRATGYISSNKKQFDAGQKLVGQWLTWFIKNKDAVQKAFDK
ncbi:MAG: glycosyltransferase family 39 protein [Candidatus Omnitrophica bacterium]|nr:glycosyltransferase family 39 protein [Candidatus Omnitrophota bacterium]MBU1997394.1 glycosyltransferase family 39 protein [Candidatus Omnitrophota bacterium]